MRRYCALLGLRWASPAIAATLNGNRREVETKFTGKDAFHSVPDLSLSRFRKWDAVESVLTAAVIDRLLQLLTHSRLNSRPGSATVTYLWLDTTIFAALVSSLNGHNDPISLHEYAIHNCSGIRRTSVGAIMHRPPDRRRLTSAATPSRANLW